MPLKAFLNKNVCTRFFPLIVFNKKYKHKFTISAKQHLHKAVCKRIQRKLFTEDTTLINEGVLSYGIIKKKKQIK